MFQGCFKGVSRFLAATSSSRSDVVTQSVHLFVRLSVPFFSLVSLKSVAHLKCYKALKSVKGIHWESICVSRVFQKCFKSVSRVYQDCFKSVSSIFQGCFKGVSRVF